MMGFLFGLEGKNTYRSTITKGFFFFSNRSHPVIRRLTSGFRSGETGLMLLTRGTLKFWVQLFLKKKFTLSNGSALTHTYRNNMACFNQGPKMELKKNTTVILYIKHLKLEIPCATPRTPSLWQLGNCSKSNLPASELSCTNPLILANTRA